MKKENIILLRQRFDDFDHYQETAHRWSLDFKQMDNGRFQGDLILLDVNKIQLASTVYNRKFEQGGITPKGFRSFAIPFDNPELLIWRGKRLSNNNMVVFPKSREVNAISEPGFSVYTISLAQEIIDSYIEGTPGASLSLLDTKDGIFELPGKAINRMRQQLHYITKQINTSPEIIQTKAFQQIFSREIPSIILSNLFSSNIIEKTPPARFRDISLKKAVEYIKSCTNEMPSVIELCLIAGVSERTLEYAFKENYGFGPKEYMNKQRLNHVYLALKKADQEKAKVGDVAQRFGFWHMGQFGVDYKKLFGELPSETLKKETVGSRRLISDT